MTGQVSRIRVFVASPGDVGAERRALGGVVQDVNLILATLVPDSAILELVTWESHVHPELGRPQGVITDQVGDYDVLIGMMWRRFGTPSTVAASGTEEEVRDAYARWERTGSPRVMFYFSLADGPPPASKDEADQMARIVAFREELGAKGLVKFYAGAGEFPDVVRRDLILLLGRILQAGRSPADAAVRLAELTPPESGNALDRRIQDLADEYFHVRDTMLSGHTRTRQMEIIASRMRALAGQLYSSVPLLSAATGSKGDAPGRRLAAITFLQAIPHPGYLQWLSERFGRDRSGEEFEKPFVQYHAGVALLSAVRVLGRTHSRELRVAIAQALDKAAYLSPRTDRYRVLKEAATELEQS